MVSNLKYSSQTEAKYLVMVYRFSLLFYNQNEMDNKMQHSNKMDDYLEDQVYLPLVCHLSVLQTLKFLEIKLFIST